MRRDSFNARLARFAAREAGNAGAKATLLDLGDFDLPLYNGDLEADEGLPAGAVRLKELFLAHDGFLIASPEYNGSLSPLMKNAIDWVSRPVAGEPPLVWFTGKVAGLMAASPGALGGLRGLVHLRQILSGIGVIVAPAQHAIARAGSAFDNEGGLAEEPHGAAVRRVVRETVRLAAKLGA
ncbi:MAG: NAD(P)H-dependent oxidoreductase [Alphaproteobacteria bacterium]|nr:NAD(P)H-dependent oxidoreductase [Alphaproteobacteria bacterium]